MLKRLILGIAMLFFIGTGVYIGNLQAQEIKIEGKKIDYILPYAGILPDHPLYFLKVARDHLLLFLTRDNYKKAQLDLLFSDKRLSMANALAQKGKWDLSISTLSKGELYTSYIPELLTTMKKQGSSPPQDFILTVRLSSEKHQEVIEDLIQDVPQDQRRNLENALRINEQTQKKLSAF